MDVTFIAVLVLAGCIFIFMAIKKSGGFFKTYKAIPFLLTKAEANFFRQLNRDLPNDFHINSKVRLADICTTVNNTDIPSFNRIARKHVDFVITEHNSGKVVCAIELDDRSHLNPKAFKGDQIKNSALDESGVKLVRIKNTRNYKVPIQNLIENVLKKHSNQTRNVTPTNCTTCLVSLEKKPMKFPNQGNFYWECPSCNKIVHDE